jgi:hypothetical protein
MKDGAGGYAVREFQELDIVRHLRRNPPGGRLYSNVPAGVHLATGLECRFTPVKEDFPGPGRDAFDMARFRRDVASSAGTHIVWFRGVDKKYLFTLEEIREAFHLEPVMVTGEGAIYKVGL